MAAEMGTRLVEEVSAWKGVSTDEGRFGSTRLLLGRRKLGHLHPPSTLDMPLPPAQKRELVRRGEAEQHRWTPPSSGWVTVRLGDEAATEGAIGLLRERYEHARQLQSKRSPPRGAAP
ncbi:MAG TPA: luciferase family protein [Gemmatimonadales bacterium]|nr:luciferase family protein [Gemmatimonadales bacterium]